MVFLTRYLGELAPKTDTCVAKYTLTESWDG